MFIEEDNQLNVYKNLTALFFLKKVKRIEKNFTKEQNQNLANNLKFKSRGVSLFGMLNVLFAKSLIN